MQSVTVPPMRNQLYDKVQIALVVSLERDRSPLVRQLLRCGLATIASTNRAKQIIGHLHAAWRLADRTVSYKLRQRRDPEWLAYRDSWADMFRRGAIVFETIERNRRRDGRRRAVQKAVRAWTRKLTPAEHRLSANPMPKVEWEYEIADALIRVLERELMRPLRFSRRPFGDTYGADLEVLVAAFDVAVKAGIFPDRNLLRGKGTRRPGSANWFVSRIRYHRNQGAHNGARNLTVDQIVTNQKLQNRRRRGTWRSAG